MDEAFIYLGDEAELTALAGEVAGWTGGPLNPLVPRTVHRLRGALPLRLGRPDEAEAAFREGLAWAERERCPVEAGRCLQGLAEVAERRGDHGAAMTRLDQAAALFQQHGAALYLRQVLAKKDILKA